MSQADEPTQPIPSPTGAETPAGPPPVGPGGPPGAPPPGRRAPSAAVLLGIGLVLIVLIGAAVAARRGSGIVRPPGPVASPTANPAVARPSPSAVARQYTVRAGDTLQTIARTVYGNSQEWQRIYDANRSTIGPNPDALRAGMVLQIPPG